MGWNSRTGGPTSQREKSMDPRALVGTAPFLPGVVGQSRLTLCSCGTKSATKACGPALTLSTPPSPPS